MSPVMRVGGEGAEPKGVRPHLVLKLKLGWALDEARSLFVSDNGEELNPQEKLPQGCQILHMAPSLARKASRRLSEAERDLVRYVQVVLPKGQSASTCLRRIRKLPCVEEGRLPPKISLPSL